MASLKESGFGHGNNKGKEAGGEYQVIPQSVSETNAKQRLRPGDSALFDYESLFCTKTKIIASTKRVPIKLRKKVSQRSSKNVGANRDVEGTKNVTKTKKNIWLPRLTRAKIQSLRKTAVNAFDQTSTKNLYRDRLHRGSDDPPEERVTLRTISRQTPIVRLKAKAYSNGQFSGRIVLGYP
ncbi:uncharacterized protein [Venturia canescens]|uniref:uncharacterized protein n=1 Tax=Venturia canescens TaxID=32260 RepID=UPI001C9C9635|nr:uncharacterized protein LOC122406533 [Venturia canescens]